MVYVPAMLSSLRFVSHLFMEDTETQLQFRAIFDHSVIRMFNSFTILHAWFRRLILWLYHKECLFACLV
jgi:hypothetical protein